MTITFHIEANSVEELRLAACNALDLKMHSTGPGVIPAPVPDPLAWNDQVTVYPVTKPGDMVQTQPAQVPELEKSKKPSKNKKLAPLVDTPADEVIPEVIPNQGPGPDDHEEVPGQGDINSGLTATSALPSKELLALKDKVIASLSKAFSSGKRDEVRSFLAANGNGAKSFREIDVAEFPLLAKKAQEAGLAA